MALPVCRGTRDPVRNRVVSGAAGLTRPFFSTLPDGCFVRTIPGMNNADIVRTACRVIWSEGQLDRIGEFYADDFSADYPMTDWGEGIAGIRALAAGIRQAFPDYAETIEELIDAGSRIVVRLRISGTQHGDLPLLPATGRRVEFRDMTVCELHEGRIARQWGLTDYLTLYAQLGLVELPGT